MENTTAQSPTKLDNMLVLLICVEKYDSPIYDELPGTQTDRRRLSTLFKDTYNYEVIQNESSYFTKMDMKKILIKAEEEFQKKDKEYQGIMVFLCITYG